MVDPDAERVAAIFDPHSDQAWQTMFPDPVRRREWRNNWQSGAVTARDWNDAGFSCQPARSWHAERFTPEEAWEWINVDFQRADHARRWLDLGFTPTQTKEWRDSGVTSAQTAADWLRAEAPSALKRAWWTKLGFTAQRLAGYRDAGWDSQQILRLDKAGIADGSRSVAWTSRGFSLDEIEQWAALDLTAKQAKTWRANGGLERASWWRTRFPAERRRLTVAAVRDLEAQGVTLEQVDEWTTAAQQQIRSLSDLPRLIGMLSVDDMALLTGHGLDVIRTDHETGYLIPDIAAHLREDTVMNSGAHPASLWFHHNPTPEILRVVYGDAYRDARTVRFVSNYKTPERHPMVFAVPGHVTAQDAYLHVIRHRVADADGSWQQWAAEVWSTDPHGLLEFGALIHLPDDVPVDETTNTAWY